MLIYDNGLQRTGSKFILYEQRSMLFRQFSELKAHLVILTGLQKL